MQNKIFYLFSIFNSKRKIIYIFILLFIFANKYEIIKSLKKTHISVYEKYIKDCSDYKSYKRQKIIKEAPFISICLPLYNMEKYVKRAVMSIINQTFQNFEIIIVNDFSNDNTKIILEKLQQNDERIKIINHNKNMGVYSSRVDGFKNSKGNFIILMDPDDMLLTPYLFENLYSNYLKYNLDMIEFSVFYYEEKNKRLYIEKKKYHYHFFQRSIIYQPELSGIIFYKPNTKKFTSVICRPIWNKMIRKEILLKTINYIGIDYYNIFFITAEDTLINVLNFQYSRNYSNIDFPGYMYNKREVSMSHGVGTRKKQILFNYNYFLYIKKLYKIIKDFKMNKNFFFYEFKEIKARLEIIEKLDKNKKKEVINFYKEIN